MAKYGPSTHAMFTRTPCRRRSDSEFQDETRPTGTGHADHHEPAVRALVIGEHGVPVVRLAVQDGRLTGPARPLAARRQDRDAGLLDRLQDRAPGLHLQRPAAERQLDL